MPPSQVHDPSAGIALIQYRAGLWVLPICALALVIAWYVTGEAGTPLDRWLLPPLALTIALLEIPLALRWLAPSAIWTLVLVMTSSYLVASLGYEIAHGDYGPGLPPVALWLLASYVVVFIIAKPAHTMAFLLAYFVAGLIAWGAGLALAQQRSDLLINASVQFMLASLAALLLLRAHSRIRGRFSELHRLAHTDSLTGLANRRFAEASLRTERAAGSTHALLMIDVDRFKAINDSRGHGFGDLVLKELARALSGCLRGGHLLARWGGEEFVALLPGTSDEEALRFAEHLRQTVEEEAMMGDQRVTVSVGIACARAGESVETLLARADAALYRAKQAGRNRVESDLS